LRQKDGEFFLSKSLFTCNVFRDWNGIGVSKLTKLFVDWEPINSIVSSALVIVCRLLRDNWQNGIMSVM